MENPEENPDWSISLSSFQRMAVFILLLFIAPIFLLLLCGRPERFRTATRDNEDSEQSQPHGQPSCSSRQVRCNDAHRAICSCEDCIARTMHGSHL
jgi:hypothetical protein